MPGPSRLQPRRLHKGRGVALTISAGVFSFDPAEMALAGWASPPWDRPAPPHNHQHPRNTHMKYGGGLAAGILFELHLNHYHPMPDIGVACLDPLLKPGETRREGWTYNAANITEASTAAEYKAAADYTATVGE